MPDLDAKIAFLRDPSSYPEPTATVHMVETHMSCVFLTDRFVYKMKKPLRLPWLDFRALEDRRFYCGESLRLNRRLAPDVYLDVLPLVQEDGGRLRIGGAGREVEWLEKMVRLPESRMLDRAIERGTLTRGEVVRFARPLARFYRDASPVDVPAEDYGERFREAIAENCTELADPDYGLDAGTVRALGRTLRGFVDGDDGLLGSRAAARRIVEGHGDLRPEHVCLLEAPVIIDCLEFDRELRLLDPVDELAGLALECELAGAPFVGPLVFETYREITGDGPPQALVDFYRSCRALTRSRLSAWHVRDHPVREHPKWLRRAGQYLSWAATYAQRLPQASSSATREPPP